MGWEKSEVLSKMVVRTNRQNADGLEEVEVHWGGGGEGEVWRCIILPEDDVEQSGVDNVSQGGADNTAVPALKRHRLTIGEYLWR